MTAETNLNHQTKNILYIEDEPFIGQLYSRALERAGYKVTLATDGRAGLELAQTDRFDIILLDLMLPELDGRGVLTTLRDTVKTPSLHAKIITITNLEQDNRARAAIESLVDGYLIKADVTPHDLIGFLGRL